MYQKVLKGQKVLKVPKVLKVLKNYQKLPKCTKKYQIVIKSTLKIKKNNNFSISGNLNTLYSRPKRDSKFIKSRKTS